MVPVDQGLDLWGILNDEFERYPFWGVCCGEPQKLPGEWNCAAVQVPADQG
jgi:hypothetical protein